MFWTKPGYVAGYGAGQRDRAAERDLDTARHLSRALFGAPRPAPVVYSEEVVRHLNAELDRIAAIANENNACFERAKAREASALLDLAACKAELAAREVELGMYKTALVDCERERRRLENYVMASLKAGGHTESASG